MLEVYIHMVVINRLASDPIFSFLVNERSAFVSRGNLLDALEITYMGTEL